MPLTETEIKALRPDGDGHRFFAEQDGLYLRIHPTERRTWIWRKKKNGRMTYGNLSA